MTNADVREETSRVEAFIRVPEQGHGHLVPAVVSLALNLIVAVFFAIPTKRFRAGSV